MTLHCFVSFEEENSYVLMLELLITDPDDPCPCTICVGSCFVRVYLAAEYGPKNPRRLPRTVISAILAARKDKAVFRHSFQRSMEV